METRKFISRTAQQAVQQIQAELGPNAVVLDVRKLPRRLFSRQKFEITATVQELEAAPDSLAQIRNEIRLLRENISAPGQTFLSSFLVQSGLLPKHAELIAREVDSSLSFQDQLAHAREILRVNWRPAEETTSRCHVFIGPPGSGKSTVLCKWLAQHILSENRGAAILQLDAHTPNLSPQPRYYAEILGARFSRLPLEFAAIEADTLFVDLPGIEPGDATALETAGNLIATLPSPAVHLVLNAGYDAALLLDQARRLAALTPSDIIVTRLDEEQRWGKVWNLIFGTNFSIRSLSAGQNVPGGLIPATAETVLVRQFGQKPL